MADQTTNGTVVVDRISKSFGSNLIVNDISLRVDSGEFISLLGPSGSGKTTTLMMIAGFERPDKGSIILGGQVADSMPPQKRNLGFVFQSYALFPHMTIAQNVAYPLELRKVPKADIERKVTEALRMVDLPASHFGDRRPSSLSGGQQQRVALARAIVFGPRVMLLDEPLGALDKRLREQMLDEFRDLHRRLGTTMIYVTHDQGEALTMSDRIAVFADGRIQQIGEPMTLYNAPANEFVAKFLGDSNGIAVARQDDRWVSADGHPLPAVARVPEASDGMLIIRPENIGLTAPEQGLLRGSVTDLMYAGDHLRLTVRTSSGDVVSKIFGAQAQIRHQLGETVGLTWLEETASIVPMGKL